MEKINEIKVNYSLKKRVADVLSLKHSIQKWNLEGEYEVKDFISNKMQIAVRKLKETKYQVFTTYQWTIVKLL